MENRDWQPSSWREWKKQVGENFPYEDIDDPKYIEAKDKLFAEGKNGWWWGWTKQNTPLKGIYSWKDKKSGRQSTGRKKKPFKEHLCEVKQ